MLNFYWLSGIVIICWSLFYIIQIMFTDTKIYPLTRYSLSFFFTWAAFGLGQTYLPQSMIAWGEWHEFVIIGTTTWLITYAIKSWLLKNKKLSFEKDLLIGLAAAGLVVGLFFYFIPRS